MRFRFGWRHRGEQIEKEIQSHLEMAAQDRMDRGEHAREAGEAARREFGNVGLVKEMTRESWGWRWLEDLLQDIRYGLRMLRKSPGFTVVAMLTLALGIGANTAIFSVIKSVLLQPLPFHDPNHLVRVFSARETPVNLPVSGEDYFDWQSQNRSFESTTLFTSPRNFNASGAGEPETVSVVSTQSNFFSVLGVRPQRGREFAAGEDQPGKNHVALLSSGFSQRHFGGIAEAIGKTVRLNFEDYAVVGVMPEDYLKGMGIPLKRGRFFTAQDDEHSPHVIVIDDVFARKYFGGQDPIGKRVNLQNKGGLAEIVGIVGHVKQWGLDSDDAESLRAQLYFPYMQLPDRALAASWSGTNAMVRFKGTAKQTTESIRAAVKKTNNDQVLFGVATMDETIARSLATRRFSMILLGIFAALALVLASVGVYGLISYLVGQRLREIGIRLALGAQRHDVLRLVLAHGAKLALVGVAAGLLAGLGLTRLLEDLLFGVKPTDAVTFAGVAVILMLVALLACYVPARRAMRIDPTVALRHE